ncbi:hypothetical protein [Hymenobacter metallilatus]|uniref:Lipoprotein n=1 Tax=Hymenobacter metallilatus TaxID=2493666 RepID=A0A3R9MBY3_9BACT|nr:hypothetical protein [Hymenobacter metallilatus]RSK36197.1 hypothetical protein EI290_04755 [Hymenobacter metallilatus]
MLRTFLTWACVLIMASLLAACCGSVGCECNDRYADAVGLRFSADTLPGSSLRGFKAADIRTVYLVRVPNDTAQRPKADTVAFTSTRAQQLRDTLVINNLTPFTRSGNRNLNEYRYEVYLAPARSGPVRFRYRIDRVALQTSLRADGCCTCYQNTNKLVYVNGSPTPLNLTDPAGNNQLVPLVVVRP